jgi:hypothetical protein
MTSYVRIFRVAGFKEAKVGERVKILELISRKQLQDIICAAIDDADFQDANWWEARDREVRQKDLPGYWDREEGTLHHLTCSHAAFMACQTALRESVVGRSAVAWAVEFPDGSWDIKDITEAMRHQPPPELDDLMRHPYLQGLLAKEPGHEDVDALMEMVP